MHKLLLALSLALPLAAQASTFLNIQEISCSGDLSSSGDSLLCGGDLTLRGGSINTDRAFFIKAGGNLGLNDLNIQAHGVFLHSMSLLIGADVRIEAHGLYFGGDAQAEPGNISPWAGVIISNGDYVPNDRYLLGGNVSVIYPMTTPRPVWMGGAILPVPEPSPYAAMLAGLATLAWVGRRPRRKPA